jgi:hypothetical protein
MYVLSNSLVELSNGKIFGWGHNFNSEFSLKHSNVVFMPEEASQL